MAPVKKKTDMDVAEASAFIKQLGVAYRAFEKADEMVTFLKNAEQRVQQLEKDGNDAAKRLASVKDQIGAAEAKREQVQGSTQQAIADAQAKHDEQMVALRADFKSRNTTLNDKHRKLIEKQEDEIANATAHLHELMAEVDDAEKRLGQAQTAIKAFQTRAAHITE